MSQVRCYATLDDGKWRVTPSLSAVRKALGVMRWREPVVVEIDTVPGAGRQMEIRAETQWEHGEIVRDRIVEALLRHLGPEYDSMVEVEVQDD